MPRLGKLFGRAFVQQHQAVERKDDLLLSEAAERIYAEWEARCGNPEVWHMLTNYHSELRCPFPDDSSSSDPGPWLEMWWRLWLRQEGAYAYWRAAAFAGWSDKATLLGSKAREALEGEAQIEMSAAVQRKADANNWGGISVHARVKAFESYITTALYFKPHGFGSVDCVASDSPLGRLLLHGLHVLLATAFDRSACQHLHHRHVRSVVIQDPLVALQHYKGGFTGPNTISTFTGHLPPVTAQVPLFDHLALHWQLKLVNDVLTGVLVSPAGGDGGGHRPGSALRPPPDTPYHWSAFNKLLVLGTYAPVEEALQASEEQHTQLAMQQLQDLANARQAESASAGQDLRKALSEFRVVLHEQLQAELAVGQAALQLCAAALQEQQPNDQQQPVQLTKLKQQLQACHIADLWAQQGSSTTTSNNNGSGSSGADAESPSRSQQLAVVLCALIAWPLAVLSDTVSQSACSAATMQHRQPGQGADGRDAHAAAASCHEQLQQVVRAAASGLGGEQQGDAGPAPAGLQDFLFRQLEMLQRVHQRQQQQQQQEDRQAEEEDQWQEALEEAPLSDEEQLMALLVQLLRPLLQGPSGSEQHPRQHAGTGAGGSTAAQHTVEGGCSFQGDATQCVTLQAVTRCVCHVLLVRLLATAPPCEAWSWEACVALLQLLVSCQQAAGAAGNLLYVTLAASTFQCSQDEAQQQQQQQQQGQQQQDDCHEEAAQDHQVKLLAALQAQVAQRLLQVLQGLQQMDEALQHCSSNGSSGASGSSSSEPRVSPQQAQDGPQQGSSSRQGRGQKAVRVVQDDACQQVEMLAVFSQPTFWRSQTFQLYSDSRHSGSALLKTYFNDWRPDNHRPGFWGLVGKFAAAEQLNLRHSQDLTAFAAAAPVALPPINEADDSTKAWLQQPVVPRVLARIANMQLLTQGTPALELGQPSEGMPVQLMALDSLLQCALLAVQQPQLLPYASLTEAAQRAHADRDGDVFSSPSAACLKPGAASGAGSARRGGAVNGAAAAAAAAAASLWQNQAGFHLHSLLTLGPLFEEAQQGPCLLRLLQLLTQFHAETAAAASSALQHHLVKELKQRRLWVPPLGSGSSSSSTQSSCIGRDMPPDRSRLLVLLMGLYHLQMLEQQQDQQRRQRFKQAQQQKDREWAQQRAGRQPRHGQGQQQQQEQNEAQAYAEDGVQRLRPMHSQNTSSRAGAGAGAAASPEHSKSLYADLQLKRKAATSAAAAACSMHDLLLYCLVGGAEQYNQTGNSSSGSRYEVCSVSAALVADGTRIASQVLHNGSSMPEGALCDVCCVCKSVEVQPNPMLQFLPHTVPPACDACEDCGGHFWCCRNCAASREVAKWHTHYCTSAGGAFADAYRGIRQTASKSVGSTVQPSSSSSSSAGSTPVPHACDCNACSRALVQRAERASLRWRCSPLAQFSGPWAQEQQYGLQQRRPGPALLKPRAVRQPLHVTKLQRACGVQGSGVPAGPSPHTFGFSNDMMMQMVSMIAAQRQEQAHFEAQQQA